jgi:FtsZ-binding cell division protein ZapB
MRKENSSEAVRSEIEELREEAATLADRAKRTVRQAEVLAERIKQLESQLPKRKTGRSLSRTYQND